MRFVTAATVLALTFSATVANAAEELSPEAQAGVDIAKQYARTDKVKSIAGFAAAGAVIAIPIPIIGPVLGAAAGAGYGWYRAKKKGRLLDRD